MPFSTSLNLEPSATVTINSLALKKRAAGERVYNLSAGEPLVPTNNRIVQAAYRAMQTGKTQYPPVAGIPELRTAAAVWMNSVYGTRYSLENTVVTCGGKFGIFALAQLFLKPGDEAMIVAPYWVSYPGIVGLFGGVPKIVMTEVHNNWKVTVEKLERAYSSKTKLLFINNASNPTGTLYSRLELEAVVKWAKEKDILVVADEVYSGLVYEGEFVSAGSFPELADHVVVVQSCSKHFAMTGWRVGFAFGPPEIIKDLITLQGQSTSGTASVSQWAALEAFAHTNELIAEICSAMRERRDVFREQFERLFNTTIKAPASALYYFLPLTLFGVSENDSAGWCERILTEANVALVPGSAFGVEGYVRASFGASGAELTASLERLAQYMRGKTG